VNWIESQREYINARDRRFAERHEERKERLKELVSYMNSTDPQEWPHMIHVFGSEINVLRFIDKGSFDIDAWLKYDDMLGCLSMLERAWLSMHATKLQES